VKGNVLRVVRSHPFLLLGIATLAFTTHVPNDPAFQPLIRVVIVPVWIGWNATAMVANSIAELPAAPPSVYQLFSFAMSIVGGLLLYALADGFLWLVRRSLRAAWDDYRR
jgi:hypothetical protein